MVKDTVMKVCPVCYCDFPSKSIRHKYCTRKCALKSRAIYDAWFDVPTPPLNIESDLILLTSDWHIPFDKEEYIRFVLKIAKKKGISDFACIGDFWDCDNYSRYTKYTVGKAFQAEIKHVKRRLLEVTNVFERSFFCVGNHEARFLAANAGDWRRGHLKFEQMMNITGVVDGYEVTDNRWMTLNDEWRLTHPHNYSRIKLNVAKKLATKHLMNIINTHGHFTSGTPMSEAIMEPDYYVAKDRDTKQTLGVFRVADIGGLFDPSQIEYLTRTDSTFPRVNPGFAIYDHGEITIIDFEKYFGSKKKTL